MRERLESSVSPDMDEWGELCFPGVNHAAVIRRTPEELGIPRIVSDTPAIVTPRMAAIVASVPEALRTARWPAHADLETTERRLGPRSAEPRKAKTPRVRLRRIKGVAVRMPANAVTGAEMIDGFAAEAAEMKERGMPGGKFERPMSALKLKVLAEPDAKVADLVARLGASKSQIYNWRYSAKRKAGAVTRPKKPGTKLAVGARKIDVDPHRLGTAYALISALARRDASTAAVVRVELTHGEVASIIGKLSYEQRGAFLAAGLKAAILG